MSSRFWTRGVSVVALGCGKMGCCCFVAEGRKGEELWAGRRGCWTCGGKRRCAAAVLILADEAGLGLF